MVYVKRKIKYEINNNKIIESPLHLAIRSGHMKLVLQFLQRNMYINALSLSHNSPLHLATSLESKDIFMSLLNCNPNVNVRNRDGLTALHMCVKQGNLDFVKALCKHLNTNLNCRTKSFDTPVHLAITSNNLDVFYYLVRVGADLHLKNKFGFSPLHVASQMGLYDVVETLLQKDVDVNAVNSDLETCLHIAVSLKYNDIAELLLKNGCDADLKQKDGETVLMIAARNGSKDIVENLLLTRKVDCNALSNNRETALHLSVLHNRKEISEILLRCGSNPNLVNKFNESPLIIATRNSSIDLVKLLISYNADVNCRSQSNDSPLHIAIFNKRKEIFEILLGNELVDVNAQNDEGDTPLHSVIKTRFYPYGFKEGARSLLLKGSDINIENKAGDTPLTIRSTHFSFGYCELHNVFIQHVHKLNFIGLKVSEKNMASLSNLESFCKERNNYTDREYLGKHLKFMASCEGELQILKDTKLSRYTSLYDIIFKKPYKLPLYSSNEIFNSESLEQNFPIYGYLLKSQLKRGMARRELLDPAKDYLEKITALRWPDPCCYTIFKYFSDENLQDFVRCAQTVIAR